LPPNEAYGTAGFEGGIVFFDAYLVDAPHGLVEPEVLTPHYSEAGLKISEVEARPTPLVYPVIPRGAVFAFLVASRDKRCGREGLKNLLKTVLTRGVGAKTALGFGRFRVE
jgi:CRISPR-associated protein Cmr6